MTRLILLVLLCLCNSYPTQSQTSLKEIDLDYGQYHVGFQYHLHYDSSRTYQRIYDWDNKHIPRPMPTGIWYPTRGKVNEETRMTILQYMEILKQEEEWEHLPNDQILNWFYYSNTSENQKHLSELTKAHNNVDVLEGKFPLVVYAPSYQASSIENFALCEFLASHGYVVVSNPSRGTKNRYLEGGTAKDMETQARDIEFLIQKAKALLYVDANRIAVAGFSFGGLSNMLVQMRNDDIKAILSLDGTVKYRYKTLMESAFSNTEKVDVPFLHMSQKDIPENVLIEDKIEASLNSSFTFYDSLKFSRAYQLKFHDLSHSYFSTLGVLFNERDPRQDKSDPEIMQSYKLVCDYSLNFLDAFLKGNSESLKFLSTDPEELGVEKGLISIKRKEPEDVAFTFRDFNEKAANQSYKNLGELHAEILDDHSAFLIEEWKLNNLGLQLLYNSKTSKQAISVFQFATQLFPKSSNLFDSLAEAHLFLGQKDKAIVNFEKSLELNKENQNAINRLEELK
ncbi:MAG: prolyl oligopeptidase family serine peptidase [Bacteroidota bacterium]